MDMVGNFYILKESMGDIPVGTIVKQIAQLKSNGWLPCEILFAETLKEVMPYRLALHRCEGILSKAVGYNIDKEGLVSIPFHENINKIIKKDGTLYGIVFYDIDDEFKPYMGVNLSKPKYGVIEDDVIERRTDVSFKYDCRWFTEEDIEDSNPSQYNESAETPVAFNPYKKFVLVDSESEEIIPVQINRPKVKLWED